MLFSKENNMEKSCDKNQKQKEHKILITKKKINLTYTKEKNKKRKNRNNKKIKDKACKNRILKTSGQKNQLKNLDKPNINVNQKIYLPNYFEMNQTEINTLSYKEALGWTKEIIFDIIFLLL